MYLSFVWEPHNQNQMIHDSLNVRPFTWGMCYREVQLESNFVMFVLLSSLAI